MPTPVYKRAIGYVRVSTRDQADSGASLAAQRAKVEAYAVLHDMELAEIIEEAPRLWREVDGLRAEHVERVGGCARVLGQVNGTDSPLLLRRHVNSLLGRFERHRYRGADLVYEAFDVDIGGG